MFPTKPVSHAATWMVATSLLMLTPAFAGQKPKDWSPGIDPANFAHPVDNPYFPLSPTRTWSYRAATKSGIETLSIEVTGGTKDILGVTTRVVIETAKLNGETIEIAENWFAPDNEGNVWYFGEFTQDYVNGVPNGTEGSWVAGGTARPGIIMKAHPMPGDTYFQEFAPGIAQDMASVISITKSATVMGHTLRDVLLTKEWTALEPNSVEHKSYAPGIGLVLEEKGGARLELVP